MRALIFHSRTIAISESGASTRPAGIAQLVEKVDDIRLENVATAWVCIEAGDTATDRDVIRDAIAEYSARVKRKVLLIPFAHLSADIADPATAKKLLQDLRSQLEALRLLAGAAGFGSHKVLEVKELITKAHPGDWSFRDSRSEHAALASSAKDTKRR